MKMLRHGSDEENLRQWQESLLPHRLIAYHTVDTVSRKISLDFEADQIGRVQKMQSSATSERYGRKGQT